MSQGRCATPPFTCPDKGPGKGACTQGVAPGAPGRRVPLPNPFSISDICMVTGGVIPEIHTGCPQI